MKNYSVVPNILSNKDLDYLTDMFQWNYGAYKSVCSSINNVKDKQIKAHLKKSSTLLNSNMKQILNILGGNYEKQ